MFMLSKFRYFVGTKIHYNDKFKTGEFELEFRDIKAYGQAALSETQAAQAKFLEPLL